MVETKIKGERIFLRLLTEDECTQRYVNWLNDPQVNRYLETRWEEQSLITVKNFVLSMEKRDDSFLYGIFLNKGNNHIGNIKIGPINYPHLFADISYFIGNKSSWGNGYASEAVKLMTTYAIDKLRLNTIIAGVYASNVGSINVLKKNNYLLEGVIRNKLKIGDKMDDHLIYTMHSINIFTGN